MMTDNRNSELDVIVDVPQAQSNAAQSTNLFIRLLFANIICLVILLVAGWYFIIRPYIGTIESKLSEATTATRGVASVSDVEELRRSVEALQIKVVSLEQYGQRCADIQRDIQRVEAQLKEIDQKTSADANKVARSQGWRDDLSNAINNAEPLASFRQNPLIPEKFREMIAGVDFIPTHKNISESWAKIRSSVKFQAQSSPKTTVASESWWGEFKVFLKSIFNVRRLDKDYLTPEEVFVRQVDNFLIENNVDGVCQWVDSYMNRFDGATQPLIKAWADTLQNYQRGQLILKMVK
jgi:hypothetical protein